MLFDSTVRKELARSFGATLMVILTIFMTNLVIRTLGLAANGAVAAQDVVFIFTLLGLVMQIVGDVMYTLVDPRIDFESRR